MEFRQSNRRRLAMPGTRGGRGAGVAAGAAVLALAAVMAGRPAGAVDLSQGDVSASVDVTITHGLTFRTEPRKEDLTSTNDDDGARNYARGIISNTSQITAEFEMNSGPFGAFARINGFQDFENQNGARSRTPLSDEAKDLVGRNVKLLDLYVTGAFEPYGMPLDLRLGNQVLSWGESTFIPNGINVINPYDVSRLRTPGAELRDALVPVPMISAAAAPLPNLSVEGFYQFAWEPTEIDPVGTYFSTTDYVGAGGNWAYVTIDESVTDSGQEFGPLATAINADLARHAGRLAQARVPRALLPACVPGQTLGTFLGPDCQAAFDPRFLAVARAPDREPRDDGQWGAALRVVSEDLNDTEFGFFFVNSHSRLPLVTGTLPSLDEMLRSAQVAAAISAPDSTVRGAITQFAEQLIPPGLPARDAIIAHQVNTQVNALAPALAIDRLAKATNYVVEYPEDLVTVGASFNTALPRSGWAIQGEYSFHPDLPLQRSEASLFAEALEPLICFLTRTGLGQTQQQALASCPIDRLGKDLQGNVERDVSQAQITATKVLGPILGADAMIFIAEAAVMYVHNMPPTDTLPLDTPAAREHVADATSMGYRGAIRLDFNNAIGAARLSPYVQFQHGVSGNSPAPFGPFVEGRKVITLGASLNYLERWRANVSYTLQAGSANYLSDRDFLSLSLSYAF